MRYRAAAVLMGTLALAATPACRTRPRGSATPPEISMPVQPTPPPAAPRHDAEFLGVVVAPQTVDVTAQLAGRLLSVVVRVGDRVQNQSVVAKLDIRSARREVEVARAELATAQAAREQAALDDTQAAERFARRSTVVELPSQTTVSTVSAEELSAAHYQTLAAKAKLTAADATIAEKRAKLAQMELAVKEGVVRAPFDGVVVARYVDGGATVRQGQPIVRLLETGDLRVRFAIPEDATELTVATPVHVRVAGQLLAGVVEKVAPEVDTASRMIFAEASLAPASSLQHALRSGQVARVSLSAPVGDGH